jgi:uncharacterized membrane protein
MSNNGRSKLQRSKRNVIAGILFQRWLTIEILLGGALVLMAVWGLRLAVVEIPGIATSAWYTWIIIGLGGLILWLLLSLRLAKKDTHARSVYLTAAIPFTPLLVLWFFQMPQLRFTDRDLHLFILSLVISLTASLLAYRFWLEKPLFASRLWQWLMIFAATVFVVVFGVKSLILYQTFTTGGLSPAAYDQALWNGLHWFGTGQPMTHFMSSSLCCDSILSDHAYLIMPLLIPFYAVGLGGPMFLMIIQAMSTALAALAVYKLANERLGPVPAVLLGLAYLFYFVNQRTAAGDFRTDALVAPLLLWAIYACSRRQMVVYYVLVLLALACKEEVALVVFAMGLYLLFFENQSQTGAITVVLATAWYAAVSLVVIPYFGSTTGRFYPYFRQFGSTPLEALSTIFHHPGQLINQLLEPERVKYLLFLFVPLGILPLLGAPGILIALPRLALNMLSGSPTHYSLDFWYEFNIVPFLFLAVVLGIERLGNRGAARRPSLMGAGAAFVLVGCAISARFWGPNPLAEILQAKITTHDHLAQVVLDRIPPEASVAAQSNLVTRLAHRQELWVLPDTNDADYLLFDVLNLNRGPQPLVYEDILRQTYQNPDYGLIFYQDGYLLFKRGVDNAKNRFALTLNPPVKIQYPQRVSLGDSVLFLGFDLSQTHAHAGETVDFSSYWLSLKPVQTPYLLLTGFPGPGAWHFGDPVYGLLPITQWVTGDIIKDQQAIVLPYLPDGNDYEIILGFWHGEGEPQLESPEQLLGQNIIRIRTVTVRSGQYTFRINTNPGNGKAPP